MNANKIKQLAEKMGWKIHSRNTGCYVLAGKENSILESGDVKALTDWNPEISDADMVELLQKLHGLFAFGITTQATPSGWSIQAAMPSSVGCVTRPTLRAAVVSFACKCWNIPE